LAGRTAVPGCDSRQADGRIIAQRRDGFQAHLACALHGPLIILFEQQGTDEPDDGGLIGQWRPRRCDSTAGARYVPVRIGIGRGVAAMLCSVQTLFE